MNNKRASSEAVVKKYSVLVSEKGFVVGRRHSLHLTRNPERPEACSL